VVVERRIIETFRGRASDRPSPIHRDSGGVFVRMAPPQLLLFGALEALQGGRVVPEPVIGEPNLKQEVPHLLPRPRDEARTEEDSRGVHAGER